MAFIYLVEDDENIRELVIYALKNSGHEAVGFENESDFHRELMSKTPDLILLDIMLPQKDGITILKELKNSKFSQLPVIMITAKGSEYDKVKALDLGADDYVVKPFGVMELLSRIHAVLRRSSQAESQTDEIEIGGVLVKKKSRTVWTNGEECILTYKEYELLVYLIQNKNIVVSREKIMDAVWGFDYEGESRTVDVHIKTLRQKLKECGSFIKTVRNVGYVIKEG